MQKYDNIFNRDFYPTPNHVLDLMELDAKGKVILEPSAGKGNIIDYVINGGAERVVYCEINDTLAKTLEGKGEKIASNFFDLKKHDISGVDLIIMNPPFSEWKKHILHAWEIAPQGCEIVSLFNYSSASSYDYRRSELRPLVENYGFSTNLGAVFAEAERETDVQIGMIKIYKPITTENLNFDDYFDNVDDVDLFSDDGIIRYSEIDAIVNTYKSIIRQSDNVFNELSVLESYGKMADLDVNANVSIGYNDKLSSKQQFLKDVQKRLWSKVFSKMNINKYLTSGVMEDLNNWIDNKQNTPFTKRNIFKMIEVIYGTKEHQFNRALLEAVDSFTRYTHENRYNVEGWKTNAGHLLNKKIIVSRMCEESWDGRHLKLTSYNHNNKFNDLLKVLCNITGTNYDNVKKFDYSHDRFERGVWYDSDFFQYKGFKKGSMHFKFKDNKVWEEVNRRYAKIKGAVLPEKI